MGDRLIATASLWQSIVPRPWTVEVVSAEGVLVPMIQAWVLDVLA